MQKDNNGFDDFRTHGDRRQGDRRRFERRGFLRWDPLQRERRSGKDRRRGGVGLSAR